MTCGGCNLIEFRPVESEAGVRCAVCPDIEARIICGMDLEGRRAAIERIRQRGGDRAAEAVKAVLAEMWKRK